MAVNNSRDNEAELKQGIRDGSYMDPLSSRGGVIDPADRTAARMKWPAYGQANKHKDG